MIGSRSHRFIAIPIALIATGCATVEPYLPPAVTSTDDVPLSRAVTLPSFYDASSKWELPVRDAWAPYVKLTLLSALDAHPRAGHLPDVESIDSVVEARKAAASVAAGGLPSNLMWIVDLRGAASVAFGATLSQRSSAPISPVMTFNNWPSEREVVPAEETLSGLCTFEPRAPSATAERTVPIFLLDAWRLAYRDEDLSDEVTDNRYMLTPSDFPSAEVLRAQGIERVVYVVEHFDGATVEEDDLHATFLDYQRAGIAIHIVDIGWLTRAKRMHDEARWFEDLPNVAFYIEPRSTVVVDPEFYERSPGGFGGVQVGPMLRGHGIGAGLATPHVGGHSFYPASPHVGGHGGG